MLLTQLAPTPVHTSTAAQSNGEFTDFARIEDDGGPIVFHWAFPRGTLDPRMSALELAEFVLHHMPRIIPLFAAHPHIQQEFAAMFNLFLTTPKAALDEVLPWILPVTRKGPDDVITMNLRAIITPERTKVVTY